MYLVGCIYRPPGKPVNEFLSCFQNLFQNIPRSMTCYFLGDFNINLLNSNIDVMINNFTDLFMSFSLFPMIMCPTRITKDSNSLIDNIFTNNAGNCAISGILLEDISDHLPIFSVFNNFQNKKPKPCAILRRNVNEINICRFGQFLKDYQWNLNVGDANIMYDDFESKFVSLYDTHFPLESKTFKKKRINKPWFTNELRKLSRKKEKLYNKFIKHPTALSENNYKCFRNYYTKILRQKKKAFYKSKFDSVNGDSKRTWKEINNILNKTKEKCNIPESLIVDNVEIHDEFKIAQEFNNFFIEIGSKLCESLPDRMQNLNTQYSSYLQNVNEASLYMKPISEGEIISVVQKLKNKTSPGYDDINITVIKQIIPFICKPLADIFNKSIQTGIVPNKLKLAKVTPVFKSGSKQNTCNYRPISVLSVFSKILEKCVYNRLYDFLCKHNILSENQFGFRKGLSTSLALTQFLQSVVYSLDNKKSSIGVFLDLSKAFDTIDHSILLYKLNHYGIRGVPHSWIKNYLSNRQQFVCINSTKSHLKTIRCGVPQGSILGPLLFLLYVNDIRHSSPILQFTQFADDTSVFFSHENISHITRTLNSELGNVHTWLTVNKLVINLSKTSYMIFSYTKYSPEDVKLELNNYEIKHSPQNKFLGVYIDESLSWKYHISEICNKLAKVVGIIYRLQNVLPENILLTLYNTLFLPHITYCNINWANCAKTFSDRIYKLQKKAVRLITHSAYNSHSSPLFARLNILTIHDVNKLQVGTFMYMCKNNLLPSFVKVNFSTNSVYHSYSTRRANDYHLPKVRTSIAQMNLNFNGPKVWNALPTDLKNCNSLPCFKRKYKKHLIKKYIDSSL